MKKLISILITCLLCLLCLGCNNSGKESASVQTHMVTDSQGHKLQLPTKPQRIVSLTLGTDELVMDLVSPDRIAALSYLADDPGISHISERSRKVPKKVRDYNAEALLALKPDLVIIADWWQLNMLQTLRDMGIKVYVYKTPYKVADIPRTIEELALVLGEAEQGQKLIHNFQAKLQRVDQKLAGLKHQRSVLTISGHGVGGQGSLYDDMCGYAKVANCLHELNPKTTTTVSKEFIIQKNPDLLLLPSWNMNGRLQASTPQELLTDPALATVKAIRHQQLKQLSGRTLFCVSHYVAEGIEELASTVYPEYFQ